MTKGPDGSDRRENAFGLTGGPTLGEPLAVRMRAGEARTHAAVAPTMQALSDLGVKRPMQTNPYPRPRWRAAALAVAVAAAYGLTPGGEGIGIPAAHAQTEQVRAEIGKPLQAARDLIKAQKYKEALARLREAEAVPNRTAYENFVLEQMRASAAAQAGDYEQAIKSFQALLASGRLGEAEQGRYAANLAALYYRTKDYGNAANWAARALKSNPGDQATRTLMIQSYYLAGDYAAASREALADIQAAERAGQTPPEDKLQLLANVAARNGGDRNAYIAALERLVTYYPKREYWADLLRRIESKPGFSSRLALDVLRLKLATKTMNGAADYFEMAQLALQEGQAAEAKKVLDEGFAAGVLGKGPEGERHKRLLALAEQRARDAAQALKTAEAEAASDKDGNALVRIGLAFNALGQHDKGIALIQQGIAKGGLKRPHDANLHLGIALLRAGQKQRAAQVFKTVGGTDGTADLARLWMRVP
jgi:tetratricopeptide (TPR) repeat protein